MCRWVLCVCPFPPVTFIVHITHQKGNLLHEHTHTCTHTQTHTHALTHTNTHKKWKYFLNSRNRFSLYDLTSHYWCTQKAECMSQFYFGPYNVHFSTHMTRLRCLHRNAKQHRATQSNTEQRRATQSNTEKHRETQSNTEQHRAIQSNAEQHRAIRILRQSFLLCLGWDLNQWYQTSTLPAEILRQLSWMRSITCTHTHMYVYVHGEGVRCDICAWGGCAVWHICMGRVCGVTYMHGEGVWCDVMCLSEQLNTVRLTSSKTCTHTYICAWWGVWCYICAWGGCAVWHMYMGRVCGVMLVGGVIWQLGSLAGWVTKVEIKETCTKLYVYMRTCMYMGRCGVSECLKSTYNVVEICRLVGGEIWTCGSLFSNDQFIMYVCQACSVTHMNIRTYGYVHTCILFSKHFRRYIRMSTNITPAQYHSCTGVP